MVAGSFATPRRKVMGRFVPNSRGRHSCLPGTRRNAVNFFRATQCHERQVRTREAPATFPFPGGRLKPEPQTENREVDWGMLFRCLFFVLLPALLWPATAANRVPVGTYLYANPAQADSATGALTALISRATGKEPYFVGKPNPLMIRSALRELSAHSESTAMVGDRMDTDMVAGLEAGLHTVLVLSGVSSEADAQQFPYRPSRIVTSVDVLATELEEFHARH